LTTVITLLATLALISDHPEMIPNSDPFVFVLVASVAIIFVSVYRREQERSRMGVLIDREARLQLILEQMPAILWTTDENLIITSATGSGFQHIPADADEMIGSWIASAPPIEKVSMFRTDAHYDALMGQSGTYESQWGDVTFQCFVEPLYDVQHRIIGCVGVALDITDRRSAEQVAVDFRTEKERVQVLSDFIQNATHDLSTPLSVINASIYLLRNSTEPDKQQRHIDTLNTQTERLDNLVKSMLTMLRLDKTDSFSMEYVDLNQMMRNLPMRFQAEMQVKRLTLQQDFDTTLPEIQANESYMLQALHEVLDNAIQFTNVGGIITLRTRYENDRAIIEIIDTGIGIAPEDQVRIFERFYQVDKSHATSHSGSGLGLAIVRRVIDGHKGRIHVRSIPSEGTNFRIALPIELVSDAPQLTE
jgi:signal transduction histidine kinase